MLEVLKQIGNGTPHQFSTYLIVPSLPNRNGKKSDMSYREFSNVWFDIHQIKYSFLNGNLLIQSCDFFPESIVEYINSIPNNFNGCIILEIISSHNETAGLNMLFDSLSRLKTNHEILINLSDTCIGEGVSLEYSHLPSNVKITSLLDRTLLKEGDCFGNNCFFEYWAMNIDDNEFNVLLSKLSLKSRERIQRLREIPFNFYQFMPDVIKNSSDIKLKSDYIYQWCCQNISYDFSGTMPDGSFNFARKDTQDAIITFERRKGVCAGRAKLFKLLTNNYYMKIPCFIVDGMAGNLQHEWNEVILENGECLFYDISKQRNLHHFNHFDYKISKPYLEDKKYKLIRSNE